MHEADVVVVGAGASGLSAALAAARAGARTLVFEAAEEPGGSARWSAGSVWTERDYDRLRHLVPLGRADLQRLLVEGMDDCLDRLAAEGLPFAAPPRSVGGGRVMDLGRRGDRRAFMSEFGAVAAGAGARIELDTRVRSSARTGSGFALEVARGGARRTVRAGAVVLASGGFQANRELLRRYLGNEADRLMLRTTLHARGDGLSMGLGLGAGVSRGLGDFYGHTMPLYADRLDPTDFKALTLSLAADCVLLNAAGDRFTDEAAGLVEETNAVDGLYQPGGIYYLMCDARRADGLPHDGMAMLARKAGVPPGEIHRRASSAGELARAMEDGWGVPAQAILATLGAVERAARGQAALVPPRSRALPALDRPDYHAVRCIPAITYSYGGLAVGTDMGVLDGAGEPLGGLFAAGNDAGGVFMNGYAGGLAWALVSGRRAGERAARVAGGTAVAA